MADSSKDIQLHELKDMINDLKKMIKTLQATVDAANKREESLTLICAKYILNCRKLLLCVLCLI